MEICPPGVRPNSGAYVEVWMRNSCIASTETKTVGSAQTLKEPSAPQIRSQHRIKPAPIPILALTPSTIQ